MREAAAIGTLVEWSGIFPGDPAQAGEMRRFLAAFLDGREVAGDALLCVSELAANAILHSDSGQPGGTFSVRAVLLTDRARIEVTDAGGPWQAADDQDGSGGRGLMIVDALASDWGVSGHGEDGRAVWFEIAWA